MITLSIGMYILQMWIFAMIGFLFYSLFAINKKKETPKSCSCSSCPDEVEGCDNNNEYNKIINSKKREE